VRAIRRNDFAGFLSKTQKKTWQMGEESKDSPKVVPSEIFQTRQSLEYCYLKLPVTVLIFYNTRIKQTRS